LLSAHKFIPIKRIHSFATKKPLSGDEMNNISTNTK